MSLDTELGLETTLEVRDVALAVVTSVGGVADLVEHHATGEEQDGEDSTGAPKVTVGGDEGNPVPELVHSSKETHDGDEGDGGRENGERSRERGVRATWSMLNNPTVDGLGSRFAVKYVREERSVHSVLV